MRSISLIPIEARSIIMQVLMYWLEILPSRPFWFHLSFFFSPVVNYSVQREKGPLLYYHLRELLSIKINNWDQSIPWWKTLREEHTTGARQHTSLVSWKNTLLSQIMQKGCTNSLVVLQLLNHTGSTDELVIRKTLL